VHVRSRKLKKADGSPDRVQKEFAKHKVRILWFEDILRELKDYIKEQGRTCSEETLSFVQLCDEFKL
jgi:hypothetical protein